MTIESIRSIIGDYLDLSDPRHAQMMRKLERELTAATCELCGGTDMHGPDAVPCPSGCTPPPQTQMTGYEEAIDAAKMARNRLMTYANGVQRGEIQGGGREFERRIWGAFSDFDQACAALTTEGQP